MDPKLSVIKIHKLFKTYRKKFHQIWESYNIIEKYLPKVRELIKNDTLLPLTFHSFYNKTPRTLSKDNTIGSLKSILDKSNSETTLIMSVSTLEDFLGILCEIVYTDFPNKLRISETNKNIDSSNAKYINYIIDSIDINEVIRKIAEDKIKSLFYGNPLDVFNKDKAKLEFKDYFSTKGKSLIEQFAEINARRNIIIHNGGRVDKKYLNEVNSSSLKLGCKVLIDSSYLQNTIATLESICGISAALVVTNVYKFSPQGLIHKVWKHHK